MNLFAIINCFPGLGRPELQEVNVLYVLGSLLAFLCVLLWIWENVLSEKDTPNLKRLEEVPLYTSKDVLLQDRAGSYSNDTLPLMPRVSSLSTVQKIILWALLAVLLFAPMDQIIHIFYGVNDLFTY